MDATQSRFGGGGWTRQGSLLARWAASIAAPLIVLGLNGAVRNVIEVYSSPTGWLWMDTAPGSVMVIRRAWLWNLMAVAPIGMFVAAEWVIWTPVILWTARKKAVAIAGMVALGLLCFLDFLPVDAACEGLSLLSPLWSLALGTVIVLVSWCYFSPPTPSPDVMNVLCPSCGYDLRGQRECRCPECGREFSLSDLTLQRWILPKTAFPGSQGGYPPWRIGPEQRSSAVVLIAGRRT
jgi:hypothetical protein